MKTCGRERERERGRGRKGEGERVRGWEREGERERVRGRGREGRRDGKIEGEMERLFPRAFIPSDSRWDSRLDRYRAGHSWALSSEDGDTITTCLLIILIKQGLTHLIEDGS